jgi:hypothetical protein
LTEQEKQDLVNSLWQIGAVDFSGELVFIIL